MYIYISPHYTNIYIHHYISEMAAQKCGMCPFEAMDHLWFHQIVISSKFSSKNISTQHISSQVESRRQESDHVEETTATADQDRATKLYLVSRETRSHSSSPASLKKQSRILPGSVDLELQEVKGFMDLGFVFKEHNLSSHVISLIPGLRRIKSQDKRGILKPYLSESWLVRMPDSPLVLSLRISRVCNDSDKVKKHLKDWARTVAAAIHQEF
ncbi:uncharacterized protein LOC131020570 [Salvia miltiorrhiza]|uniref:uncharacterized protein LOC131020570 n=1 Tax=Salvia miltiorrhiza TaxID=226208 RepID=UPI0025AB746E|nr:uncharacterized protein LOC131020570 [Salvia miltiorrhiza]